MARGLSDKTGTETITGPAAGVTVNADGLSRVFQVDGLVKASISGLTITGGHTAFYSAFGRSGGGLLSEGALTLTNCTVSGNFSYVGGGLYNDGGTATLTNCTVSGNSSESGGGVENQGTATLTNCTVSDNSGGSGGAAAACGSNYGTTVALTNCTVSGNSARQRRRPAQQRRHGRADRLHRQRQLRQLRRRRHWRTSLAWLAATLTNCTVSSNSAIATNVPGNSHGFGGGVYEQSALLTLSNCTVSGNFATYSGGGLFCYDTPGTATR